MTRDATLDKYLRSSRAVSLLYVQWNLNVDFSDTIWFDITVEVGRCSAVRHIYGFFFFPLFTSIVFHFLSVCRFSFAVSYRPYLII